MNTKDLTISQVEELVASLEAKIQTLESQILEYRANASRTHVTWKDLLRTEVIRMLADKDDAIKTVGAEAEHVLIKTALEFNCNRRQETAIILGYGRNTITKKVTELNIDLDV
jgi:two-component system, NtrC family, nitrogen regulation response regulator GlnG